MVLPILPIVGLLAEFAPSLVRWIAGDDAGKVAEKVTGVVKSITGTEDMDEAASIMRANPDKALDFKRNMAAIEVEYYRIDADDRKSARDQHVAMKDRAVPLLGTVIICGFLGTVGAVLMGYVDGLKDPITATLLGSMIGYVSAKADQVVAFYFGSSRSSQSKDLTIANLSK